MDKQLDSRPRAWFESERQNDTLKLTAGGCWLIACANDMCDQLEKAVQTDAAHVIFDLGEIEDMDTTGAWLVHRSARALRERGADVAISGAAERYGELINHIAEHDEPCEIEPEPKNALFRLTEDIGANVLENAQEGRQALAFVGRVFIGLGECFIRPRKLRFTSMVYHIEQVGLRAIPIVSMMAFLIGVVIAYISAQQFRELGGEVFVVDLLAISILREIGVIITAIVVAGRSGSAFTAQIGSMKLHEEIDAMNALGLDPIELLVTPRVWAMLIAFPLLTFIANLVGLFGGGIICWAVLDINPGMYIVRLNQSVDYWDFLTGMIKAFVLPLAIAIIGCFEGMQVRRSAESVGARTTRSVVEAISLIIIIDAIFAIFYNELGI